MKSTEFYSIVSTVTLGNTEKLLDKYEIEGSKKYKIMSLVNSMKQKRGFRNLTE